MSYERYTQLQGKDNNGIGNETKPSSASTTVVEARTKGQCDYFLNYIILRKLCVLIAI